MAEKAAAVLTIRRGCDMTKRGRRNVAKWLRRQADFLESDGKEYSPLFTARYIYDDEKPTHAKDYGVVKESEAA